MCLTFLSTYILETSDNKLIFQIGQHYNIKDLTQNGRNMAEKSANFDSINAS